MRFQPRHYILIAVILAVGVFRLVQSRRTRVNTSPVVTVAPQGPVPQSAAWTAFDKAAALRDAPSPAFMLAFQNLQQEIDSASKDSSAADLRGCRTWLEFYRQSTQHPSSDTAWRQRSTQHLDTCVKAHRDVA